MTNKQRLHIFAIVAMAENRIIGKDNQLPWHLPADLKHFKQLTTGHTVIMGRKTYQSIGKPLPNRTNIIISRDPHFHAEGCTTVTSPDAAIAHAATLPGQDIFIIGGANIYATFMDKIERIYLTMVHQQVDGDTYFPALDAKAWQETQRERHSGEHFDYSFITLQR